MLSYLEEQPELALQLVQLLGSSSSIGDILAQNPDLAYVALEPSILQTKPTPSEVQSGAQRLLHQANSFAHGLDRLRYAKQRRMIQITAADLSGVWEPPDVWNALSNVAEGLITQTYRYILEQEGLDPDLPALMVVAFGKLGARELNYSSDVDLVYLVDPASDSIDESRARKLAERLTRALTDRMGRGALYRVDLRLRPFGGRGAMVSTVNASKNYYQSYAEAWEQLALIRSRCLIGSPSAHEEWQDLRETYAFPEAVGEWAIEAVLKMRDRMDQAAPATDIKRARGGIRDIELTVQIFQMLHGRALPPLRTRSTQMALAQLAAHRIIPQVAAEAFWENYLFLRQVEHRCQMASDVQTHELPASVEERTFLARRAGFETEDALVAAIGRARERNRHWYNLLLGQEESPVAEDIRAEIKADLGDASDRVLAWLDSLPQGEAGLQSLRENRDSLQRIRTLAELAPMLIDHLIGEAAVSEQIISGEALEEVKLPESLQREKLGMLMRSAWLRVAARCGLLGTAAELELSALLDRALPAAIPHPADNQTLFALGSYAAREMTLTSDLDALIVADSASAGDTAMISQSIQNLRIEGWPMEIDFRLRPQGKQGPLIVTWDALRRYAETDMEPWERLALGLSRQLGGDAEATHRLRRIAFDFRLNHEMLDSLLRLKRRVENERVPVGGRDRHLKLSPGGIDDLRWLTQIGLLVCQEPWSVGPMTCDRLDALRTEKLITQSEADLLMEASTLFIQARHRIALLGWDADIIPENPKRLRKLAEVLHQASGEALLSKIESVRNQVREIFDRGIQQVRERL